LPHRVKRDGNRRRAGSSAEVPVKAIVNAIVSGGDRAITFELTSYIAAPCRV
jgi:hypothetical protein